mmetsp:Transcript_10646/g.26881  ORF Transcript_10646/g.26881 Transcript_10646/m.26881 type:complete len:226 (+) Transcript_10646:72-749(+)
MSVTRAQLWLEDSSGLVPLATPPLAAAPSPSTRSLAMSASTLRWSPALVTPMATRSTSCKCGSASSDSFSLRLCSRKWSESRASPAALSQPKTHSSGSVVTTGGGRGARTWSSSSLVLAKHLTAPPSACLARKTLNCTKDMRAQPCASLSASAKRDASWSSGGGGGAPVGAKRAAKSVRSRRQSGGTRRTSRSGLPSSAPSNTTQSESVCPSSPTFSLSTASLRL